MVLAPRFCRNSATLLYKSISTGEDMRLFAHVLRGRQAPHHPLTGVNERRTGYQRRHRACRSACQAGGSEDARTDRGRPRPAVSLHHVYRSRRLHSDFADPQRRRHAAAGERDDGPAAAWRDRARSVAGDAGPTHRTGGRAAACAHRRIILHHRRGPRDPGGYRRERYARPRPRPAVLHPHTRRNREFADRGGSLFARSRADRAIRYHGHGHRNRALQTGLRARP